MGTGKMRIFELESLNRNECTARKKFPKIQDDLNKDQQCIEFWYNSPIPGKIILSDQEEKVIDLAATPRNVNYFYQLPMTASKVEEASLAHGVSIFEART